MDRTKEIATKIFKIASDSNIDSSDLVLALADVLAATGANLKLFREINGQTFSIEDSLDSFIEMVKKRYPQILQEMTKMRENGK